MNKAELINELQARIGNSKSFCAQVVEAIFGETGIILENLSTKEDKVRITGFGIFSVSERKARPARNPKTGQKMMVEPKTVRKFRFSTNSKTV